MSAPNPGRLLVVDDNEANRDLLVRQLERHGYEVTTAVNGRAALEWFHAHMALAPQPPLERVPQLPPVLSSIILKLLAKMAEERYPFKRFSIISAAKYIFS